MIKFVMWSKRYTKTPEDCYMWYLLEPALEKSQYHIGHILTPMDFVRCVESVSKTHGYKVTMNGPKQISLTFDDPNKELIFKAKYLSLVVAKLILITQQDHIRTRKQYEYHPFAQNLMRLIENNNDDFILELRHPYPLVYQCDAILTFNDPHKELLFKLKYLS